MDFFKQLKLCTHICKNLNSIIIGILTFYVTDIYIQYKSRYYKFSVSYLSEQNKFSESKTRLPCVSLSLTRPVEYLVSWLPSG